VPIDALLGVPPPAMSNRAFDTSKLGSGYGFESHPQKRVEMPPTWALLLALGFMIAAMAFWVWLDIHIIITRKRC
jgi:dolichyl-phosphate beta-glucosyltransferase